MTASPGSLKFENRIDMWAKFGQWLCVAGCMLGALGLSGWITGATVLTTLVPGQPPMMPNTALCLVLIGIAGAFRIRGLGGPLGQILSLAAFAIAAGTVAEYVFRIDLGLDQFFLRSEAGPIPGRPSPPTALALTLLAASILLFEFRPLSRVRFSEGLALIAGFIAFVALLGFIFGAGPLYRLTESPVIGVAVPTGIGLILISLGVLLGRPDRGLMCIAGASAPGGMLFRRLVLPALIGPALLGLVVVRFFSIFGMENLPLVVASLAAAMAGVSLVLLFVSAAALNRLHLDVESGRSRMRDLIEQASDGIFVADLSGRYTDVNTAGCRMLGYSREEIIGKTIMDLIPSEAVDRLLASRERMLRGGIDIDEWTLLRKDGFRLPVEVSAKILPDGRWQGLVRDITERKRAEEEHRLLAKLGLVLASTLDYEKTLSNVARLAVEELSDVCIIETKETGPSVSRFRVAVREPNKLGLAAELQRTTRPAFAVPVLDSRAPILLSEVQPDSLETIAQDGERLRVLRELNPRSLMALPLLAHGELFGAMILVGTDPGRRFTAADLSVAEQVAGRAALALENARLYETARRAVQARDEVLGIVAHDLRNPLASVLLQVRLLRRPRGEPERRSQDAVERIYRSGLRMNRLIEDLLDVARLEAGRFSIERRRIPARELVHEAVEGQRAMAAQSSVDLNLEAAPELPDIAGDRERLLRVLQNLIDNAVKFSAAGDRVTIGAAPGRGDVVFWVADTGPGIPAHQIVHIFDRFWQGKQTDRRGTGLGLAIVKGIVEAHGGRVWVESTPGEGSTFSFTIPAASRAL